MGNVQFDESSRSYLNADSFTFNKANTNENSGNSQFTTKNSNQINSNFNASSKPIDKDKKIDNRWTHIKNYTFNFHVTYFDHIEIILFYRFKVEYY